MKPNKNTIILGFLFFQLSSLDAFCQTTTKNAPNTTTVDSQTIDEIDAILKQNLNSEPEVSTEILNRPLTTKEIKKLNVSDYSKIVSDTEFVDYSVIQKNYMPKSSRLQIKAGIGAVTNDVFYTGLGLSLNAIYNFNEDWGIGLGGILLNSSRNKQTQNIRDVQSVNVENLITLKNTYNASVYFSPIYGKWSLLNKKILPFEIYFSAGVAQVTNQSDLVGSALSGSIGQLVSLGRSSAVDVNLQGLVYTTKNINNQEQSNNSLLLTIGYSVFWPEPDYR